jgi:CelD/BcsL family acetyltransferase involved in cellulose biosynthesis
VKISVCKPAELGESELALWRGIQQDDHRLANPFLSPEFIQAKGRHLDGHFVAVIEEAGKTVGFVPFQRTTRGVAVVRACIAGTDVRWNVADLMQACRVSVLEYEDLAGFQQLLFETRNPVIKPTPMVNTALGWDTWLKQKSSSSRFKRQLRKERNLLRDHGEIEFEARSTDHTKLDVFMDWKSQHFQRTGHANRFASPTYRAMVHDLLDTPGEQFFMSFLTLGVGGRTVAMETCLNANQYVSAWQTTHDPDPAFDKYSCGMILSIKNVEVAAANGATCVDLGIGANPYKELLKDYDVDAVTGWTAAGDLTSRVYAATARARLSAETLIEQNPKLRSVARGAYRQWSRSKAAL